MKLGSAPCSWAAILRTICEILIVASHWMIPQLQKGALTKRVGQVFPQMSVAPAFGRPW